MLHASQPTAGGKRARRSPVLSPPSSPTFSDLHLSDELSTDTDDTEALSPVALPTLFRSPALVTAVASLPSLPTLPTRPTQPALLTQSASATPDDTSAPFNPEECRPSRLPIFRVSDIVTRQPAADRTDREVAAFTFTQWLDYFLTHPSFTAQRSAAKRRRLRDMIFEIGNSGASHDELPDVPAELPIATPGVEQRERAWAQLGEDLHIPTKSLGPDAIAVMAGEQRINVLLYINHTSVMDYGPGTARAAQHWKEATEAERQLQMQQYKKKTAGGRWVRINNR